MVEWSIDHSTIAQRSFNDCSTIEIGMEHISLNGATGRAPKKQMAHL
jgi:hypothetical protein